MKIGLIIYGRVDTLTGGYMYDRMLVDHLRQCGHRVEILSLTRRHYIRNLLDNFSPGLVSRLVSDGYDLLLQDGLLHPSLLRVNRRLKKIGHVPLVAIVHQVLCRQPRSRLINRLYETVESVYFNSVDACIFNSNSTCRAVASLTRGSRRSVVALPAGDRLGCLASLDRVESRSREPGPLRLIFVGNVLPNKGLLPLVGNLSNLAPDSWNLTVVGSLKMDCRYARKVENLILRNNMRDQVVLMGPKDGPELASLVARSHVFVMPYSHEGFGMAYLEAMGYGLPVIGSTSGAVKEFVIAGQNGFLIDPADNHKTAASLKRLDRDRQLLIKMSRAALETFHKHPRWTDTLEKIDRFLNDLVCP